MADSVYPSFLALLSSPQDPSNPAVAGSTLFPAISHYLSTLPRSSLPALASTVVTSPYLFPPSEPISLATLTSLQDAIRASVVARSAASPKLSVTEGLIGWIWRRTTDRPVSLDDSVTLVLGAILDHNTGNQDDIRERSELPRLAALAGLYEGVMDTAKVVAKGHRREVEVELLVALDSAFTTSTTRKPSSQPSEESTGSSSPLAVPLAYHIAASVFPSIPSPSLRALDLRSIAAQSVQLLPTSPASSPPPADALSGLTIVLSTSLAAVAGSRVFSSAALVEEIVQVLHAFSKRVSPLLDSAVADVYVQSYVLPLSAVVVDLLLNHPHLSTSTDLTSLLLVWHRLAPHTSRLGGLEGLDGYGRMWWGLMDLWLADGNDQDRVVVGTRRLKDNLQSTPIDQPECLNYYLMVVEQALGVFSSDKIGDATVKELVVDVCEPYLDDKSNLDVFESAHSVLLALLSPSHRRRPPPHSSSPNLLARVAVDYSDRLIRAAETGILAETQLRHALSLLLPLLLSISPALPLSVLYKLHDASLHSAKTLDLFASLLPAVPIPLLPRYLVQLEDALFAATEARSEQRAKTVGTIWDGVGGGGKLADEAREAVARWWEDVRERLKRDERMGSGRQFEAKL